MRQLEKNEQAMYYSVQSMTDTPIYKRDAEGAIVYQTIKGVRIPIKTGDYEVGYSEPVEFFNGITGELTADDMVAFGVNDNSGHAKMTFMKGELPLTEGSLIWKNSEIKYDEEGNIDEDSADYKVVGIRDEDLNQWSVLLERQVK